MPMMEVQQNTPEWLEARKGCVTASKVADVIGRKQATKAQKEAGIPGDYLKAREDYLWDVIAERLTGRAAEAYVSPAMELGIENEPLACAAYEMHCDVEVETCGLFYHADIEWFAASPDRLVGADGLVEVKCPNTRTHLSYLEEGVVPVQYAPQMLAQMACTGRKWCDFVSFDPRLPKNIQFFLRRFHRNDEHIALMEAEVRKFLEDVVLKMGALAERVSSENS